MFLKKNRNGEVANANMWHSAGKGPIWLFLETEKLRKIGEMVKKLKKMIFLWHVRLPETPLYWLNIKKVTPRLYSHSILRGNKGLIWSTSIVTMYSECKTIQKQVPHSQKVWQLVKASSDRHVQKWAQMRSKVCTDAFKRVHRHVPIGVCGTGICSL